MARRQRASWTRRSVKKVPWTDEERVGPVAPKICEGRVDLAAGAGVENLDLQPDGASSRLHVSQCGFGKAGIGRIDEHGNSRLLRAPASRRSSSRFATNSTVRRLIPVRLPPGRARLATSPSSTGSSAIMKTMGMVVVAALAADAAGTPVAAITATCGEPDRPPAPAAGRIGSRPSGIRSPRSRPRHSRCL